MKISKELEIGKAGEYLAVYSITKQGYVCYLSDQGLPYDVVVDVNGTLLRGQVKSTMGLKDYGKSKQVYRFGTRSAKKNARSASVLNCDFYVFISIDGDLAAFMTTEELESKCHKGDIVQCVEMRNANLVSPNTRKGFTHRFIQEYSSFTNMLVKKGIKL
jgi:hypothetical protein